MSFMTIRSGLLLRANWLGLLFCALTPSLHAFQGSTGLSIYNPLQQLEQKAERQALTRQWSAAQNTYERLLQHYLAQQDWPKVLQIQEAFSTALVSRNDWDGLQKHTYLTTYGSNAPAAIKELFYHSTLAHLLIYEDQTEQVAPHYHQASRLFQQHQSPRTATAFNIRLAYACYDMGDLDASLVYLQKAEELHQQLPPSDQVTLTDLYNLQTIVYSSLGRHEHALKSALMDAAALHRHQHRNGLELTYAYNNLGTLYSTLKDNQNAILYHKKALDLHAQLSTTDSLEWAICHHNVSTCYFSQHELDLTQHHIQAGLRLLAPMNQQDPYVQTALIDLYQNAGYVYLKERKLDSARLYLQQVQDLQQQIPYRMSVTHHHWGLLHQYEKRYSAALQQLRLALKAHQENTGPQSDEAINHWTKLARVYALQKDYASSVAHLQEGLKAATEGYTPESPFDCPQLDQVVRPAMLPDLLKQHLQTLQQWHRKAPRPEHITAIYNATQLATQVLEQLSRGITSPSSKRHWLNEMALPFFETAIRTSLELADQTGQDAYRYKAFELAENSQSMLLYDAQVETYAANRGLVPDSLWARYLHGQQLLCQAQKERLNAQRTENTAALSRLEEQVFQYQHELDRLRHNFETTYPQYRQAKYALQLADTRQIQAALPPKTALLEYFEGQSTLYIFCMTSEELRVHTLARTPTHQQRLQTFIQSLHQIDPYYEDAVAVYNAFVTDAHILYQELLAPVLPTTVERLLIVPDGQLAYLPFEILLPQAVDTIAIGQPQKALFSTLPYVLRSYPVNYLLSGNLWLEQRVSGARPRSGLVLGVAPTYLGTPSPPCRLEHELSLRKRLRALPGAAEEVSKLSGLFEGHYLIGPSATEGAFKAVAQDYDILHLALHGLVDPEHAQYSGLALAENSDSLEDNFLYLYEIQQMSLNTGLVVLSACGTGTGEYQRGEGVLSVGRGFMYAGAPALLTTLWDLNDESGALLIEQYYVHLDAGAAKDEALRQAKLYYLQHHEPQYGHPYLWAAFVAVGDYNPIALEPISYKKYYLSISVAFLLMILFLRKRYLP